MIARLSRVVPMLVLLAALAGIVYLVVAYRHSPNRAKEILIRGFTAITGALSAFFLLACLYSWFERNEPVFDLAVSFLITALIGLVVTRVCRAVFLRHHPDYRRKPMKTEHVARRRGGRGPRGR